MPRSSAPPGRDARSREALIRVANRVLIEQGQLEAVAEYFTPDYVAHHTGRNLTGHRAIRTVLGMRRRAFPDLKVKVEILVSGPNRIAWQRTLRGTHRASFMGFPATGRKIVWRDMLASRFRDGRIAEEWVISDLAERLLRARKR